MRGPGGTKRQKERARLEKRAEKERKKAERRALEKERPPVAPGEDPDIAGIVPGPQPRPWDDDEDAGAEETADDEDEAG
ncbi:MAG TPA: hypothetical protein VMS22_00330 [Candidatus Eisenbacteria bacterium]|nr:hypothetical protein [Candidatus Eisenbacteria bacterium]